MTESVYQVGVRYSNQGLMVSKGFKASVSRDLTYLYRTEEAAKKAAEADYGSALEWDEHADAMVNPDTPKGRIYSIFKRKIAEDGEFCPMDTAGENIYD